VKIREGKIIRFHCHIGHAFSLGTLLADVDDSINASLWNAIRAIEERALRTARDGRDRALGNRTADAELLAKQAEEASSARSEFAIGWLRRTRLGWWLIRGSDWCKPEAEESREERIWWARQPPHSLCM
jgi:hypothetical protein